jgi:hypothetical protein
MEKMRQPCLTQKAPYKGLGADSEEKHEPASDIDTAVVDSLKVLDPERPIREAEVHPQSRYVAEVPQSDICSATDCSLLDHLVSEREQRRRNVEAERLGGLEVDHHPQIR